MCISRVTQVIVIAFLFSLSIVESKSQTTTMSERQSSYCPPIKQDASKNEYIYKLYHDRSRQYVAIESRGKVGTTKNISSNFTILDVSAHIENENGPTNRSVIKIKGISSGVFLCFSKKGKLIARVAFVSKSCIFEERISETWHTQFASTAHSNWLVGFNNNGRPMKGYQSSLCPACFRFLKCGLQEDTGPQSSGLHVDADKLTGLPKPINSAHRHNHQSPRGKG